MVKTRNFDAMLGKTLNIWAMLAQSFKDLGQNGSFLAVLLAKQGVVLGIFVTVLRLASLRKRSGLEAGGLRGRHAPYYQKAVTSLVGHVKLASSCDNDDAFACAVKCVVHDSLYM
jgi:hypothetical protein